MLKRTLTLAAAAAALAVLVPLAAAPAAPSGTFTLTATLDSHSLARVDERPKGESPGDVSVFSASLRRDGRADGRAEFVQTLVDPRYQGLSIRASLLLGDGTLELQGAGLDRKAPGGGSPSEETELAVVGGTGSYAGAGGTVRLVPVGHTTQRLEITLAG
jgi:hypothetical protein